MIECFKLIKLLIETMNFITMQRFLKFSKFDIEVENCLISRRSDVIIDGPFLFHEYIKSKSDQRVTN